ncbi:hypothetical protein, partial [Klebsiella pneumoniae]|uniref:hypothetical protein n=1 Tax=Klebsiella pneumoniae TaxID=573 RepID=UPI0024AF6665
SWAIGQAWWLWSGDSLPIGLYRALDIAVIAIILHYPKSAFDWAIVLLFGWQWWAYDKLAGAEQWWCLFWLALAQMVAAGPWKQVQRVLFSVSHGPR